MTHLQTRVAPVVVRAPLAGDAPGGATLTLVPEAHAPLLGLLEDLDGRQSHCREADVQMRKGQKGEGNFKKC